MDFDTGMDSWYRELFGEDWVKKNTFQRRELERQAKENGENTPMWRAQNRPAVAKGLLGCERAGKVPQTITSLFWLLEMFVFWGCQCKDSKDHPPPPQKKKTHRCMQYQRQCLFLVRCVSCLQRKKLLRPPSFDLMVICHSISLGVWSKVGRISICILRLGIRGFAAWKDWWRMLLGDTLQEHLEVFWSCRVTHQKAHLRK